MIELDLGSYPVYVIRFLIEIQRIRILVIEQVDIWCESEFLSSLGMRAQAG